MNCKVIVNTESGNYGKLDIDKLLQNLGCVNTTVELIDRHSEWSAAECDTLIVCGGDGTLHNALEKCPDKKIVYAPCGTLNEAAKACSAISSIGKVNDEPFSYVCAAGSFTEIGYSASNKHKKRFKALAYLPQVLKTYHSREIHAKLNVDGRICEDDYTLLMVLKSSRCFGFNFNKSYEKNKGLYLVAIRSKGKDNLLNRFKMFLPFFRVFFCGVNAPKTTDEFTVIPFKELTISIDEPQSFCLDGEKRVLAGELHFCEQRLSREITVVKAPFKRRLFQRNLSHF